jgi:hypothetical protein
MIRMFNFDAIENMILDSCQVAATRCPKCDGPCVYVKPETNEIFCKRCKEIVGTEE